jgi:hypothetical protein
MHQLKLGAVWTQLADFADDLRALARGVVDALGIRQLDAATHGGSGVSAQHAAGGIEDLDIVIVDAHRDVAVERCGCGRVVRLQHLHQAAVVHGARFLLEVAEALGRQRAQCRLLLGEHLQHLAFLASVDTRRRPALFALRSTDALPRKIRWAASYYFYARFRPYVGLLSIGFLQRM